MTTGMKVAVSIPNDLFDDAEELVSELSLPRSQFYSDALRDYVRKLKDRRLTDQINAVLDDVDQSEDLEFIRRASVEVWKRNEW
jgi:metal-responsive CopG/Arc/MetJ family transcriptional regulator